MAFEGLSDKLQAAFKKLTGKGKLNEQNIKDAMREVRMALLEADVNYRGRKGFHQARFRALHRHGDFVLPERRSAGHQDCQRGTDRADGRQQRQAYLVVLRCLLFICCAACRALVKPPCAASWPIT